MFVRLGVTPSNRDGLSGHFGQNHPSSNLSDRGIRLSQFGPNGAEYEVFSARRDHGTSASKDQSQGARFYRAFRGD